MCDRGVSNKEELSRILREKVMIRRLKQDVLSQLPAKNRRHIPVCPDPPLMKVRLSPFEGGKQKLQLQCKSIMTAN